MPTEVTLSAPMDGYARAEVYRNFCEQWKMYNELGWESEEGDDVFMTVTIRNHEWSASILAYSLLSLLLCSVRSHALLLQADAALTGNPLSSDVESALNYSADQIDEDNPTQEA